MLSTKALHIMEQLAQKSGQSVTAKELAAFCGMSERSVKTYINEVEEFCRETGCVLQRKPGKGFVFQGNEQAEKQMRREKDIQEELTSREFRVSYIVYVLLTGWSTYTISLFAEELSVSRNVITDDLFNMELELDKYGLKIKKVAGKGIVLDGDEFLKRKAFRHFCRFGIENVSLERASDDRLSVSEEKRCIANYGKTDFYHALQMVQNAERKAGIWYTDYSFKMIVEYLAIQIMRVRQEKYLPYFEDVKEEQKSILADGIRQEWENQKNMPRLPKEECDYLNMLLLAGEYQDESVEQTTDIQKIRQEKMNEICEEVAKYVSEILNVELVDTVVFQRNLRHFLPASLIRAKYGFEIENPFLQEVKELYPGIFAVSFSLARYYKKYVDALPSEQELSFLALFLGGAIMLAEKHIKAVFISSCGTYIAGIVALRLEEKMHGLKVIAVISSKDIRQLDHMDYDILIGLQSDVLSEKYDILPVSSFITEQDIKNIDKAYFDRISIMTQERFGLMNILMPRKLIFFEKEKITKEELIRAICGKMRKEKYTLDEYESSVFEREGICSTSLGKGIAIPHGNSSYVGKPGISLVFLKHPVSWGEEEVDIVFLLALNFENISMTRDFFHEFTEFTEEREILDCIRSVSGQKELEEIVEKILHG